MTTTNIFTNSFKLTRPMIPLGYGGTSSVDSYAQAEIDELTRISSKRFPVQKLPDVGVENKKSAAGARHCGPDDVTVFERAYLNICNDQSIVNCVDALNDKGSDTEGMDLEDLLSADGKTSLLYEVRDVIKSLDLDFNQSTLLGIESVELFMFAHAIYVKNLSDPASIAQYIVDDDEDSAISMLYERIAGRSIISVARDRKIAIGNPEDFWSAKREAVISDPISFETGIFEESLLEFVNDYAFNSDVEKLVVGAAKKLNITLTDDDKSFLVEYFQKSSIDINSMALAETFLPIALSSRKNATLNFLTPGSTTGESLDFSVRYYEDTGLAAEVSRENVHCAAQLFYVMTLGDELGVLPSADLLITRYLATGIVDVRSPELLRDLQDYAFNDQFADLKTGLKYDRSQMEERRMFYRQVFNFGDADIVDGQLVNSEFETLWNSLMVETVRYLEKVESSENPASFVSRQNVAQPLEDLQYNLSTFCSGMAKIYSPIVSRELDFVIERLFKSKEIIDQLALHNSRSFKKVLERIIQDNMRTSPTSLFASSATHNISVMFNKAMYGHKIITAVANYNPSMIDDDAKFSELISTVEAYIIASSQLESHNGLPSNEVPGLNDVPGMGEADFGGNEWNF